MKCRPSGGSTGAASIRRHVSLREPHLRLCTFVSPRRAPSGHGDIWECRPPGMETDWRGDRWGKVTGMETDGHGTSADASCFSAEIGGCDPGLCYGYAPHTSRMHILADAVENDFQ